jgi:hypothetical protein
LAAAACETADRSSSGNWMFMNVLSLITLILFNGYTSVPMRDG